MLIRNCARILLLGLILSFSSLAVAQDDNEGVAVIVAIDAKDGHDKELIDGITKYHHWIADKEGAFRFAWFHTDTGPHTGRYIARSGDHNWADLDAEFDWQDEADAKFAEWVAPHVESAMRSVTVDVEDGGHWPESFEGYSHWNVTDWYVKNGHYGKFITHYKTIRDALVAANYGTYFGLYSVASGGKSGHYQLVSGHKGWADMSQDDPSFRDIMVEALGSAEAFETLMGEFGDTFRGGYSVTLEYMPGASDYGDD